MAFSTTSTDLQPDVAVITTGIRDSMEKPPLQEMLIFYIYKGIVMFCQASFWQHVLNACIFILLENRDNQIERKGDLFCIWKYQQNHIPTLLQIYH